tara:strand:- start:1272 stop:1466 length:195 start_codon:yes stop_codon:yes gene_type:complete
VSLLRRGLRLLRRSVLRLVRVPSVGRGAREPTPNVGMLRGVVILVEAVGVEPRVRVGCGVTGLA